MYHGPYRILKQTSLVNYIAEPLTPSPDPCRSERRTIHVRYLKPYCDLAILLLL